MLNFHTSGSTSTLGVLTAIDRLKEAAVAIDSTTNAQILLWQEAIQQRLDSISVAEGQLSSEPDSGTLAGFEQTRRAYYLEIDSFIHLSKGVFCSLSVARAALIDSAFVLNSGIIPSTDMEDNEVGTNKLYLKKAYFGNYAFTPTETDILFSIAEQCPTLGGDAVFKARGMLAAAGWELDINDDSLCYSTTSRPVLHTAKSVERLSGFLVYPNPTKDRVFVKIADPKIGKIEIRMLDVLGNTIFQQYANPDTDLHEISVSTLPLGVFFIQIRQNDEIIGTKKFFKIP